MEKEISLAFQIGLTLMALSIVISLVAFTVSLGNEVKIDAYQSGTALLSEMQEGYLSNMVGQENYIPMATAYAILRTYSSHIPSVMCTLNTCNHSGVQNLAYSTPCLIHHKGGLSGKVSLEVTNPYEGEYHIIIHPDNSWFY